jgi:uncharacterized protein YfiM (DUF2279 family)
MGVSVGRTVGGSGVDVGSGEGNGVAVVVRVGSGSAETIGAGKAVGDTQEVRRNRKVKKVSLRLISNFGLSQLAGEFAEAGFCASNVIFESWKTSTKSTCITRPIILRRM